MKKIYIISEDNFEPSQQNSSAQKYRREGKNEHLWGTRFNVLRPYNPTFIPPIRVTSDMLSFMDPYGRYLFDCESRNTHMHFNTVGGLGCMVAHNNAWKKMLDDNCDFAFVIEDNVALAESIHSTIESVLEAITKHHIDYCVMHTLGDMKDPCSKERVLTRRHSPILGTLFKINRPIMSTKMYCISRRFALHMHTLFESMVASKRIWNIHTDAWLCLECMYNAFEGWCLNVLTWYPPAPEIDNENSIMKILSKPKGSMQIQHTDPICGECPSLPAFTLPDASKSPASSPLMLGLPGPSFPAPSAPFPAPSSSAPFPAPSSAPFPFPSFPSSPWAAEKSLRRLQSTQ